MNVLMPERAPEMSDSDPLVAQIAPRITDIPADEWDGCAGKDNPFVSHAFLSALEESGSATAETGWLGQHIVVRDTAEQVIGVLPCYLKNHSQGEYVFDHAWARAYEQAGGSYYPKLQASIPFTPATGPRLLVRNGDEAAKQKLGWAARALTEDRGVSSLHVTFATKADASALAKCGYLLRNDQQFHWLNDRYEHFDDFLASLTSRKRKTMRRERRDALANDLIIETVTGADISETHWDDFFQFYLDTSSRKWGQPYLTRDFFSLIGERMAERIVLFFAIRDGKRIAGALNFAGSDTLYGRNWGCIEDHPFLHFELCYYQAIDYAIAHGLNRVEAGAQGPHKLARGYVPTKTWSAHYVRDPGFHEALKIT